MPLESPVRVGPTVPPVGFRDQDFSDTPVRRGTVETMTYPAGRVAPIYGGAPDEIGEKFSFCISMCGTEYVLWPRTYSR